MSQCHVGARGDVGVVAVAAVADGVAVANEEDEDDEEEEEDEEDEGELSCSCSRVGYRDANDVNKNGLLPLPPPPTTPPLPLASAPPVHAETHAGTNSVGFRLTCAIRHFTEPSLFARLEKVLSRWPTSRNRGWEGEGKGEGEWEGGGREETGESDVAVCTSVSACVAVCVEAMSSRARDRAMIDARVASSRGEEEEGALAHSRRVSTAIAMDSPPAPIVAI